MAHAENRAGLMTRRQFLLTLAGTGAAAVGALAQPGAAAAVGLVPAEPVAAKPAEVKPAAAQLAPAQPLVSRGFPSIDTRFPVPTEFRPEKPNSVQNVQIDERKSGGILVPEGVWFHPKADATWSYDMYFAKRTTPRMESRSHNGSEGQWYLRQGTGTQDFVIGVGTLPNFTDSQGKFTDFATRPNAVQIDTHCELDFWVVNPDTGDPYEKDGKPLTGKTSDGGDILFRVGREGRFAVVGTIPVDIGNETLVEKAYRDSILKINEIDMRPYMGS